MVINRGLVTVDELIRTAFHELAEAHRVIPVGSDGSGGFPPFHVDSTGALSVYGQSVLSTLNSFNQALSASATATGTFEDVSGYEQIKIYASVNENSLIQVFWSPDGIVAPPTGQDSFIVPGGTTLPLLFSTKSAFMKITVTDISGSSNFIFVRTFLSRFPVSPGVVQFNTPYPTYVTGTPMFWGFDDGASGYYLANVVANSSPLPTQIGDNQFDPTNIARVSGGDTDNNAATQKGLLVNSRLYHFDGSNWDRVSAAAPLPVAPTTSAISATTVANQGEASVTTTQVIVAANANRKKATFQNHGAVNVRLHYGSTATTSSPIILVPRVGTWQILPEGDKVYQGDVAVVSESGTNLVGYIEEV